VRRVFDIVLIAAIVCAVGAGAYVLGRRVDHLSNQTAAKDSELSSTTVAGTVVHHHHHSNRTWYFVAGAVGIAVGAMALGSVAESLARSRRRQRWHAT
jgi:mannose-6-phosphate isomerase-like protein (cupin superfamily)